MADLRTSYLGLDLKNPVVPSASPLSRDLDTARRLEDAGAGALVMYSLFEEAVAAEDEELAAMLHHQDIGHPEAATFRPVPTDYRTGLEAYLAQLEALKARLDIPVIASLNGTTTGGWLEHAREVEAAGADALELNVYFLATDPGEDAGDVEGRYEELVRTLRAEVGIPLTVKLTPQFSALANMVVRLDGAGADGVALFNRFYQPDFDLENLRVDAVPQLSSSADLLLPARWAAVLAGRVDLSLAVTGGVHTARDALKALAAGADVTHMCSALLQSGPEHVAEVLAGMTAWLEENEYDSVAQLKGCLSHSHTADPGAFERAGYVSIVRSRAGLFPFT